MKKWRCTVCGYIHNGEFPPEKCPVCGADKSKFVLVESSAEGAGKADSADDHDPSGRSEASIPFKSSRWLGLYETMTRLMVRHHAHPISVHVPNGVIPVSFFFMLAAAAFGIAGLEKAAFYNDLAVCLSLPVVVFSGYNEWKRKYNGAFTSIFMFKFIAAAFTCFTVLAAVAWHLVNPGAMRGSVVIHFLMLASAGAAGFIGGKLVFKD